MMRVMVMLMVVVVVVMMVMMLQWPQPLAPSPLQQRGDCHGGPGPAAHGLSLSEHQTLRGELPAHGRQTARVQRAGPAGSGNQLGQFCRQIKSSGKSRKRETNWLHQSTVSSQ